MGEKVIKRGGAVGRLAGKRAIVTAAGQGIGRASALAMAREGAHVIATDINSRSLAALSEEGADWGIETHYLNVRDAQMLPAFVTAAGVPDILFNCAGFVAGGTILDCSDEDWAFSLDLNMGSVFRICRAFLPGMIAAGGGSIINMASAVSSLVSAPNSFVFGASKAGVIGLTKSIAADFAAAGIRCNAICPGTVDSPSLQERLRAGGEGPVARRDFDAAQPMGRIARPEEVANLVVYLASDESAFTTGTTHVIDGGWSNI